MRKTEFLLAEDDIDDQVFFYEFLKNRNDIHILPALENGEEVILYLNENCSSSMMPNVIILDQNMPKMSGLQTLEQVRNDHRFDNIIVVVYSTYADERLVNQSISLGASMVMSKPTTADGYQEMIDQILAFLNN